MALRIKFQGIEYWFLGDSLEEDGAIAPLHHADEKGNILLKAVLEHSYAHWFPEAGILRYQQKIGDKSDIEIINA
jgi:hypothetical protein